MSKIINYSDIIQNQSTFNIGCLGSVSEGKSTTVRQISKTDPHRHQKERENNSTVNLGYANFKIWRHPQSGELVSTKGEVDRYVSDSETQWILEKHISFVDCPGHENFMTTMMSGTGVMNGALLLIAANSPEIPSRQTAEHMAVLERTDISKILVLQNKVDLLASKEATLQNRNEILQFLGKNTRSRSAPIIPISAQLGINLDQILKWFVREFETPDLQRMVKGPLLLPIIRSFDVNKPGTTADQLVGGVVGGSITSGYLEKGDLIEIRPGINRTVAGKKIWTPIFAKVNSLNISTKQLDYAVPGGLIGVGLSVDSFWTVSNKLTGQVMGHPGMMPKVYSTLKLKIINYLIKDLHFLDFKRHETVLVITGNNVVRGKFSYKLKEDLVYLELVSPLCLPQRSRVAVARLEGSRSTLAFIGEFTNGIEQENYVLPPNYEDLVRSLKSNGREIQIVDNTEHPPIEEDDKTMHADANYLSLLDNFLFSRVRIQLKVPAPQVAVENKKTSLANVDNLLEKIHHFAYKSNNYSECHELFRKFIATELIKRVRYLGCGALLIDGIFQTPKIQSVIEKYIQKYIVCKVCQSSETLYEKEYVICHNCGARQFTEKN